MYLRNNSERVTHYSNNTFFLNVHLFEKASKYGGYVGRSRTFVQEKHKYAKMIIGYTTGVYDMFHIGHLNILKRAKEQCDFLIVGVSTDELVLKEKNFLPIIKYEDRYKIVEAIKYVDKVVPQINKNKLAAWEKFHFNKMFVGSDWKGSNAWNHFEEQFRPLGVEIVYLDYTDGISSTILWEKLNKHSQT